MRIACPSCQAEYDVPEAMLAGRRAVRCARCGEEWQPGAAAPPPEAAPGAESLPATVPAEENLPAGPAAAAAERPEPLTPALFVPPREPRSPPPRPAPRAAGTAILAGWLATIVILAALLYGGYAWRDRLMAAWPPSTRLYAALGLHH